MYSVQDVAKYFLAQCDAEAGDTISNLKLQKLCYYAQGFHLAAFDKPLFRESIEAWPHGPVIRSLYAKYKAHGAGAIPLPTGMDFSIFDKKSRQLLDEVYKVYGQFSAWKLRNMTHEEPPWVYASKSNDEISRDDMKKYFKTLIKK